MGRDRSQIGEEIQHFNTRVLASSLSFFFFSQHLFLQIIKAMWLRPLGTWVPGVLRSAGRIVWLDGLRKLFQHKQFHDFLQYASAKCWAPPQEIFPGNVSCLWAQGQLMTQGCLSRLSSSAAGALCSEALTLQDCL